MLPSKTSPKRKGAGKDDCPTKKSTSLSFTALLERMIQHLSGEWWIYPSNYSVQIIHGSIFYCILEFIHLLPHDTKLAFHSGWAFFWHSCPPIGLAIWSFLIMVSFDPSAFFFILILHSPLSFLVLGFSDSPQFFILASHFFKLAIRGWTCCATCSASISCYEVPFCHLGKMAWMIGIPTDSAKLMMRKITKLRTSSHWMDDHMVGRVSGENLQESLWKKCNTPVWCLPKRLWYLSWKGRKLLREKWLRVDFGWAFVCTFGLCYSSLL